MHGRLCCSVISVAWLAAGESQEIGIFFLQGGAKSELSFSLRKGFTAENRAQQSKDKNNGAWERF